MASRNATRDIRTRLIIEGEDEYKAALKSNADEAKELQSEMDLLTAKFEDNADSEDYLAQRTELLARQQENAAERTRIYTEYTESAKDAQERLSTEIDKARTTMSSLQTKIEQATSEYGENSEQVQKLTTQYQQYERAVEQMEKQQQKATSTVTRLRTSTNKAERSQVEFTNAIKKSEKPMKDYDDATGDAAKGSGLLDSAINDLAGRFGVDLPESATTALGSIGASAAGISAAIGVVTAAVNAVIEAGKALIEVAQEQAEAATETEKLAVQMGVSVEELQALRLAAADFGVEADQIVDSTQDLNEALVAAQDPTSEEAKLFRQMRIAVRDSNGEMRTSGEVYNELIVGLSRISNETERARVGQQFLGEAYYELIPIIENATEYQEKLNEARESGLISSDETIDKLTDLDAKQKALNATLEASKAKIAAAGADELSRAVDEMTDVVARMGDTLVDSGAVDALAQMVEYLATVIDLLTTLSELPGVSQFFTTIDFLLKAATASMKAFTMAVEEVLGWISRLTSSITGAQPQLESARTVASQTTRGHAAGTPYSPGGVVRVGEYGPETVYLPKGSRVVNATDTAAQQGNIVNITLNVQVPNLEVLQRIVDFYENYQLTRRKG